MNDVQRLWLLDKKNPVASALRSSSDKMVMLVDFTSHAKGVYRADIGEALSLWNTIVPFILYSTIADFRPPNVQYGDQ